jgi:hypothetical protein
LFPGIGNSDITCDSPKKASNAGNAQKFHAFADVKVILEVTCSYAA